MDDPPRKAPNHLPAHVSFPEDWEHKHTDRTWGCITRVVHRLPDGRLHIWTSRRHRKGLGALIKNSPAHDWAMLERLARENLRQFHWWGWSLNRLSWWIGLIFILGSICFV
ncbi:MAG: hypothetical protein ACQKBW_11190, partial [Puniceicoccales bacterium]